MSTTMMMNAPQQQLPHRKPVPGRASYNNMQQQPGPQYGGAQQQYSRSSTASTPPSSDGSPQPPTNSMYGMPPQPQHEDPQILAKQRAMKIRAAMEVAGGAHRFSTSSNPVAPSAGIRSKIRHHGAPKASAYTGQANLAGAGVPLRLSATEMDDNDSGEEYDAQDAKYHARTGSRDSSLKGNHYLSPNAGYSNGSTPASGHSYTDAEFV